MAKVRRRSDMESFREQYRGDRNYSVRRGGAATPVSARQIAHVDIFRRRCLRLDVAKLDQRLDGAANDLVRDDKLAAEWLQLCDVIVVSLRGDSWFDLGGTRQDVDRLDAMRRLVQPVHGVGQRAR